MSVKNYNAGGGAHMRFSKCIAKDEACARIHAPAAGGLAWYLIIILALYTAALPIALAFMADTGSISNRFTVGENNSCIEERFGSYESFKKGQRYEKQVSVSNNENTSCRVRIFAEIEDPDCRDKIDIDWDTGSWTTKQEDGFYYYRYELEPGTCSEPLFTTITAREDISEFRMICYSETIQAEGEMGGAVNWLVK